MICLCNDALHKVTASDDETRVIFLKAKLVILRAARFKRAMEIFDSELVHEC